MKRQLNASAALFLVGCLFPLCGNTCGATAPDWKDSSGRATASRWNEFQRPERPLNEIASRGVRDAAAPPSFMIAAIPQPFQNGQFDDDLLLPPAEPSAGPFSQDQLTPPAAPMQRPSRNGAMGTAGPGIISPPPLVDPAPGTDQSVSNPQEFAAPIPTPVRDTDSGESPASLDDGYPQVSADGMGPEPVSPLDPYGDWNESPSAPIAGSASCGNSRPRLRRISPWFGGSNLLFLSGGSDFGLVRGATLQQPTGTGFDVSMGRYLCCGRYGVGVSYLFWGPGEQAFLSNRSTTQLILPGLNAVSVNDGGRSNNNVYDVFGVTTTSSTNATQLRASRQLGIQGIEANLSCFGIMGANRYGGLVGAPFFGWGVGRLARFGRPNMGGAVGSLGRARSQRVHIATSHGFRWFQLKDELSIQGDTDGSDGFGPDDMSFNIDVQNDLFGYQFGSSLIYRVGNRAWVDFGGKMGIYSNNARFSQRIGSASDIAFTNSQGPGLGDIQTSDSAVTLAGLGELNLGLGYRVTNGISVTGGYRLLGASGVATAVGQIPIEYSTVARSAGVNPNDSLLLSGAYVGLGLNW